MKDLLLSTIENALNAYLKCDEASERRIKKAKGKSLKVILLPFDMSFICLVTESGIKLSEDADVEPLTTIKGTPLQLFGAMIDKDNRQKLFAEDIAIEGDAVFAQEIINLFEHVEIDWEEHLSSVIGDAPAFRVSKFIQKARKWSKKTKSSFRQDVSDYLHEEKEWFPTREALDDFFTEIDDIRMDTDRLESRIARLKSQQDSEELP